MCAVGCFCFAGSSGVSARGSLIARESGEHRDAQFGPGCKSRGTVSHARHVQVLRLTCAHVCWRYLPISPRGRRTCLARAVRAHESREYES